jgi:hypothetical protein
MNIQTNIQKKVFVKIYYNSKKKHSIYIMKVLIIIIIILICVVVIKSNYESFYTVPVYNFNKDIFASIRDNGIIDIEIEAKLDEYNNLKTHLNSKKNKFDGDLEKLRNRYNNTKLQLETILFNKYRPNRLNFDEKQQAFKLKVNTFINEIKGNNLKVTNYGNIDKEICKEYPNWRLPENVPPINNTRDRYFDPNNNCCITDSKEKCIRNYKKNISLYNTSKVVLKNEDNKSLELNSIKNNIYLVNLNSQLLEYTKYNDYKLISVPGAPNDEIIIKKPELCFRLLEIKDLNHLNQFITDGKKKDDLFEYPLYLIVPYKSYKEAITIHGKTDLSSEQLSIELITNEMITKQIFYKN